MVGLRIPEDLLERIDSIQTEQRSDRTTVILGLLRQALNMPLTHDIQNEERITEIARQVFDERISRVDSEIEQLKKFSAVKA
jgi:metal-responsive CopG/Arc/MetJ family transcriptional regulator